MNNPDLFNTDCFGDAGHRLPVGPLAETLNRVVAAASQFAQAHSAKDRQFLLAAGSAGIEEHPRSGKA